MQAEKQKTGESEGIVISQNMRALAESFIASQLTPSQYVSHQDIINNKVGTDVVGMLEKLPNGKEIIVSMAAERVVQLANKEGKEALEKAELESTIEDILKEGVLEDRSGGTRLRVDNNDINLLKTVGGLNLGETPSSGQLPDTK